MALFIGWALLLGGVHAFLAASSSFTVSSTLASLTDPLRVVFIDFDRTLAAGNVGETLLNEWCPDCASYTTPPNPCGCNLDEMTFANMMAANASRVLAEGGKIINGTDRRDRLAQTFGLLQTKGIEIMILSTSWYSISATSWGNFIEKVLEIAGLTPYIARAQILTLDDPGLNIPANKTRVMENYLISQGWSRHEGLFVDDSPTNIAATAGAIDYLHVFPRDGIALDQLEWIEARANPVNCSALSLPANGTIGTCTPTVRTGEDCSITCENGWVLTGGATQTCKAKSTTVSAFTATQSCVAATCATPVVVNGTEGTCTGQTTNESCSIECDMGLVVSGTAWQTCMPTGPGTSAYPDTQSCVALCAPLAAPEHGSANTCNISKPVGEMCSFACDDGYILLGVSPCVSTGAGHGAYASNQTCKAATCASPVVVNGTAGTCTGQTANQSCSIECGTGFVVSGPVSQTCMPSGPGTSAYPDTQSCVAVSKACPASAIALFFNACSDNSISASCSTACSTAAFMLNREFAELKETVQFVEACIRNQTTLNSANTALVISRLQNGGSICAINNAQAANTPFALVFSLAMVFLTSQ
jgi:hypothetical protein